MISGLQHIYVLTSDQHLFHHIIISRLVFTRLYFVLIHYHQSTVFISLYIQESDSTLVI